MYAIIETGSKQYRVQKDDIIDVELLKAAKNGKVEFNEVLLFNDGKKIIVGTPKVEKCKVVGQILAEIKGPKVIAYKYKKRKNYHKKKGHRQKYSKVKITDIKFSKENNEETVEAKE